MMTSIEVIAMRRVAADGSHEAGVESEGNAPNQIGRAGFLLTDEANCDNETIMSESEQEQ